ncbi:hypothetical protein BDN71DRAFT_1256230 [Pleurotus eryngii]|uniref:Uncharacterized protein n=1 Tax=Pleurotus eryngii TaxID=5323 RepID=A0A9P6A4J9_PLEER|nr:hypothetical protein BDN71DRAFT_1256230 [Pleurotus eryngii]
MGHRYSAQPASSPPLILDVGPCIGALALVGTSNYTWALHLYKPTSQTTTHRTQPLSQFPLSYHSVTPTVTMGDSETLDLIRRLYEKCREHQQKISSTPFKASPREYINQLSPPPGVMHCGLKTVAIFEDEYFISNQFSNLVLQILTWKVDIYTYVTGAMPDDPNFESNGGSVMIVMVHSGVLLFNSLSMGGGSLYRVNAPVSVEPKRQLPPTNSGIGNGDYWNYTISYQELMHLFNNGGNSTIDFNALYKEDFSRRQKQSGLVTSIGVEFGITFTEHEPNNLTQQNLAGVSIFRATNLSAFPLTFSFDAYAFVDFMSLKFDCLKTKQVTVELNL